MAVVKCPLYYSDRVRYKGYIRVVPMVRSRSKGRCRDCSRECPYYLDSVEGFYCRWIMEGVE